MKNGEFYTPTEVEPLYPDITLTYQKAFERPPWNEVSLCVDTESPQRCVAGLSAVAVGASCEICEGCPTDPAYDPVELAEKFRAIGSSRDTTWYIEDVDGELAMAALAWQAKVTDIAYEKYADNPAMRDWMVTVIQDSEIIWLDEVFANDQVRSSGNLDKFKEMCVELARQFGLSTIAYRTINPPMSWVAERDFGANAMVLKREEEVPDRRDFVIINVAEEI